MFDILLTDEAKDQLNILKIDRGLSKRYKAVKKALQFLSQNPRHPGLRTRRMTLRYAHLLHDDLRSAYQANEGTAVIFSRFRK